MSAKDQKPAHRLRQVGNPAIAEAGKATRWQPGQSGNPTGARRDYVTSHLRALLDAPTAKKLARTLLRMAQRGNLAAIREVLDRADGKAITRLAGVDGEPISLEQRYPDHLATPEQRSARMIELLKGWMDRAGYQLFARKKGAPRRREKKLVV
jgi:hypothetical protein